MSHRIAHVFHGRLYRVQLYVVDWRTYGPERQWSKTEEPDWSIKQKIRLARDLVSVSIHALPQKAHRYTAFTKGIFIMYESASSADCYELFHKAWSEVKSWAHVEDSALPSKFLPYYEPTYMDKVKVWIELEAGS